MILAATQGCLASSYLDYSSENLKPTFYFLYAHGFSPTQGVVVAH